MADSDQLLIPDAAKKDPKSFELLRVWVANKGQHVSLRAGVWKDPAAWGLMLADLARHVATPINRTRGLIGSKPCNGLRPLWTPNWRHQPMNLRAKSLADTARTGWQVKSAQKQPIGNPLGPWVSRPLALIGLTNLSVAAQGVNTLPLMVMSRPHSCPNFEV